MDTLITMGSYWIRFTPSTSDAQNVYTLGSIKYVLDTHFHPERYIIAHEVASSVHFHIALWSSVSYRSNEALKYQLKKYLIGQVYISGKEIQEKLKVIAYCLKDGHYLQHNVSVTDFLQAASISKPKIKYDDLIAKIEADYQGDDKKLARDIFDAYVKTNKKVYLPHIRAQMLLIKLKSEKYGTFKEYLVDKILNDL